MGTRECVQIRIIWNVKQNYRSRSSLYHSVKLPYAQHPTSRGADTDFQW
jgi:hypothetical protein